MHIETVSNSLVIRWRVDGKKFHKTLKNHNNPLGWSNARSLMASIESDILSGHFDPTPYTKAGKLKKRNVKLTAVELFDRYALARFEEHELSNSSKVRFKGITSKLKQFLDKTLATGVTTDIAADVVAVWSEQASTRTIRAYLFDLVAAWDWAIDEDIYGLAVNPWKKSLDRLGKVKLAQPKRVKPFSIDELRAIAQGFRSHPQFSYYADAAIFISHTACRFGEMAALRWENVSAEFDTVLFSASVSRGHHRDTTKNGEERTVVLPPTVRSMLRARFESTNPEPDALVFPAPKGGYLNDNRFRVKIWKPVLESCGVEYRYPYNLRHSGVSHAAAAGASLAELSEQTGHSKKVLLSTYLHSVDRKCVFVEF